LTRYSFGILFFVLRDADICDNASDHSWEVAVSWSDPLSEDCVRDMGTTVRETMDLQWPAKISGTMTFPGEIYGRVVRSSRACRFVVSSSCGRSAFP
jgi:hypothetical protein